MRESGKAMRGPDATPVLMSQPDIVPAAKQDAINRVIARKTVIFIKVRRMIFFPCNEVVKMYAKKSCQADLRFAL